MAGADALGLVFYPASPRYLTENSAREISARIPPFVQRVGLFMNARRAEVQTVLEQVELDLLQFHGNESAAFCESWGRAYIKAVPMGGGADPISYMQAHPRARGFLLDGNALGEAGGLGKVFDWDAIPGDIHRPVILAGGLHPGNVAEAIGEVHPYAVDVSSGVESVPGVKDAARMRAFCRKVMQATNSN